MVSVFLLVVTAALVLAIVGMAWQLLAVDHDTALPPGPARLDADHRGPHADDAAASVAPLHDLSRRDARVGARLNLVKGTSHEH